ncbi:hypothetical protein JCM18750_33530 [Halostagnicola bangensis]
MHLGNQKLKTKHLPKDLSGKSVLEIGPKHGFYSIEAMNRNAESVTAIDIHPEREEVYSIFNDIFNFELDIQIGDVMEYDFDTTFDVVICFGVLHYIQDQTAFLDKVTNLADETLCIEHPVTPSVLNRSIRYDPDADSEYGWYRRLINSKTEYHAPIPSVKWIESELANRGFEVISKDTHVGVLLQRKIPKATLIPAPHRYLPCRYIARADHPEAH